MGDLSRSFEPFSPEREQHQPFYLQYTDTLEFPVQDRKVEAQQMKEQSSKQVAISNSIWASPSAILHNSQVYTQSLPILVTKISFNR